MWVSVAAAATLALVTAAPLVSAATFTPDSWYSGAGILGASSGTSTGGGTGTSSGAGAGSGTSGTGGSGSGGSGTGLIVDSWYQPSGSGGTGASGGTSSGGTSGTGAGSGGGTSTGAGSGGGSTALSFEGGPPDIPADSAEVIVWTNQTRAQNGLPPLTENPLLDRVALAKCDDMIVNNYFAHVSPTYGTPLQMQQAFGVQARIMGAENLAAAATVARAYDDLVWSPGHLANILYDGLTNIGVAVVPYGVYGVYLCQEFTGN